MLICRCCFQEWTEDDPCGNAGIINADIAVTGHGPDALTVWSDGDKMFTGDGYWLPVYAKLDNPVNRGRANQEWVDKFWSFKKDCKHR